MNPQEKLTKLDSGCTRCKAKMCSMCPVGRKKDELRKDLGISKNGLWTRLKKIFK